MIVFGNKENLKKNLLRLVKRIVFRLRDIYCFLIDGYNIYSIKRNGNICIGHNVYIDETAKVELKGGGEIIIGSNTEILEGVVIQTYGGRISIGENCSINAYTIIYGHGDVAIGNEVLIAGHCMIIPSNHRFQNKYKSIREQGNSSKGISIESNVWVGHGVTILDGVSIKSRVIIGAGAVVTKDLSPNFVYAGMPAKQLYKF